MKASSLVLWLILFTVPAFVSGQSCQYIDGDYTYVETGTLKMTILGGGGSDQCSFSERGRIRIRQNGCSLTYSSLQLDCEGCSFSGFDFGCHPLVRYGSVNGNQVTLDGTTYYPLPSQLNGSVLSSSASASGSVNGGKIILTGTGRIDTDLPINDGVRFSWTSKVTLTKIIANCASIVLQPADQSVEEGATVSFRVLANSPLPATYQWRRNGVDIPGAVSSLLTLSQVTRAQAGDYTVVVVNRDCTVTSEAARLTVRSLPAPGPVWEEGWENSPAVCHIPTQALNVIPGEQGPWVLGDTVSSFPECGITGNRACIIETNGNRALVLTAATNADCAENVYIGLGGGTESNLGIPLSPKTQISFTEYGALAAPKWNGQFPCSLLPCGDTVYLAVQDERNNQVVYILQRPTNYVEHASTNGISVVGYLEVLLSPAGGTFTRDLYEDFARVAGVAGVGRQVHFIAFAVGSAGWATLDNLRIGRVDERNAFATAAGSYNGLFYDTNDVEQASSGLLALTLQPSGTFSASLQTGSRKTPFTGRFDANGNTTNEVILKGSAPLTVRLAVDRFGRDEIIGSVSSGAWHAALTADRAVFDKQSRPAVAYAGKYGVVVPGDKNGAVAPAGAGYGSVTVAADGRASWVGVMGDGTPASQSAMLSKRGEWPFYLGLYGGRGSSLGWLHVKPSGDIDVDGRLHWLRPIAPTPKVYTNGFVTESLVVGSSYTPPGTNRVLNMAQALVTFNGGNLAHSFTNLVALGAYGRVTNLGSNKCSLKVTSASGVFTGSVTAPGAKKPLSFKGILLQRWGYGAGFFLGTNESGRVELSEQGSSQP